MGFGRIVLSSGLVQMLRSDWLRLSFGAFHYAKSTGRRPVQGIPEENGTTFSDQTGPTKTNSSYHFFFSEFSTQVKKSKTMNRFVTNGTANFGR